MRSARSRCWVSAWTLSAPSPKVSRGIGTSAALSATVNKFLRANGLLETDDHSLYSLRHSFEERMLAAGIDDRIRRDLFGHALDRERYGGGASLEMARDLLIPLAL